MIDGIFSPYVSPQPTKSTAALSESRASASATAIRSAQEPSDVAKPAADCIHDAGCVSRCLEQLRALPDIDEHKVAQARDLLSAGVEPSAETTAAAMVQSMHTQERT